MGKGFNSLIMTTRLRKTRRLRGKGNMGYGQVGQHRKHPGGRGNAGGQHHQRINFFKYHPGYFGKSGIRTFNPSVNIDKLWSLLSAEAQKKYSDAKCTTAPVIDVTKSGFFKVLGRGRAPTKPLVVKAKEFSQHAERRIVAAGGACILVA